MSKETVTVCDRCNRASCWHGEFMCDESRLAGTKEEYRHKLLEMNLEHPEYWFKNLSTGEVDRKAMEAFCGGAA